MRKIFLVILILGLGLVGVQAEASANLLNDGGFDTMTAGTGLTWGGTPWGGGGGGGTNSGGGAVVSNQYFNTSPNSLSMFIYGTDWAYALGQQTVSGITAGQTYGASAVFKRDADISAGGANALFKVEWLNGAGGALSTSVGTANFNNSYAVNTWNLVSDNFVAPAGAASAKFDIVYSKAASASNPGNVWADNANFDVVPEPVTSSLFLLGGGLLGLFRVGRRKKS